MGLAGTLGTHGLEGYGHKEAPRGVGSLFGGVMGCQGM